MRVSRLQMPHIGAESQQHTRQCHTFMRKPDTASASHEILLGSTSASAELYFSPCKPEGVTILPGTFVHASRHLGRTVLHSTGLQT